MNKLNFYYLKKISVSYLELIIILGSSSIGYAMDEGQPSLPKTPSKELLKRVDYAGRNSLHLAAAQNKKQRVELLLSADTDRETITHVDHSGRTALHAAAYNDHLAIVEYLVSQHPSLLWMITHSEKTALELACDKKHYDIIKYLITKMNEFNTIFTPAQTQLNIMGFLSLNNKLVEVSQKLATAKQEEACHALQIKPTQKQKLCTRLKKRLEEIKESWLIDKDRALIALQAIAKEQRSRLGLVSASENASEDTSVSIKQEPADNLSL